MTIEKRGPKTVCVVHGHKKKKGSKRDKPKGTAIKCYTEDTLAEAYKKAAAMHSAITHSQARRRKKKKTKK